jgi:hypothetical protein
LIAAIAAFASAEFAMLTNANPRERPVKRSTTIVTSSTVPCS